MKLGRIVMGSVLALCSCEAAPVEPQLAETGGFFDEASLLEGASELEQAACVGVGELEVRGQVATLKPQGTSLEDEQVVSGVRVQLGSTSSEWDLQDLLLSADTDALGRFCFRLPADQPLGPNVLIKAMTTPALRRLVLDPRDVDVHLSSEAVIRLLKQREITPSSKLKARFVNLVTLAETQIDLLAPVQFKDDSGTDKAVDTIVVQLGTDDRIQVQLKEINGAP